VTLGTIYQGLSGLPLDRQFRATLTQGSTTVLADPRGTYRADFLNLLSLSAEKRVTLGKGIRAGFSLEAHNVTNSDAAQSGIGTLTQAFASQGDVKRIGYQTPSGSQGKLGLDRYCFSFRLAAQ
jgi:hypothetical protein